MYLVSVQTKEFWKQCLLILSQILKIKNSITPDLFCLISPSLHPPLVPHQVVPGEQFLEKVSLLLLDCLYDEGIVCREVEQRPAGSWVRDLAHGVGTHGQL